MQNRSKTKGFTLLEMLIVIGLLVIVTTVAIPHFKKSFQEIHLNKTLDDLDSLLQSTRAYYLIMNELPEDEDPGRISEEVAWAIQANFLGPIDSVAHYNGNFFWLTIKNYSGINYDWDYWYERNNFHPQWGILFNSNDTKSKDLFVTKMRNRFGSSLNECIEDTPYGGSDYLFLSLLEIPKVNKENRYY